MSEHFGISRTSVTGKSDALTQADLAYMRWLADYLERPPPETVTDDFRAAFMAGFEFGRTASD